jgi:hypothetical protein
MDSFRHHGTTRWSREVSGQEGGQLEVTEGERVEGEEAQGQEQRQQFQNGDSYCCLQLKKGEGKHLWPWAHTGRGMGTGEDTGEDRRDEGGS